MVQMNVFRVLADVCHTASKLILIWAIHSNQSAEGVSIITQMLYVGVFGTRYVDLFWTSPARSWWNFVLKNFYILSSLYIIFIMVRVYARTREREKAWRMGAFCLGGALLATPIMALIFKQKDVPLRFTEVLWTFSIILESVCVLPQLLLLRQTTVPTVIDSFYLLTLGSYRAFYILNWILRYAHEEPNHRPEPVAVIFGIVQTAFYVDFAWVYWTRQRVKLRNGGVVDSEDLSRGWLVSRLLGTGPTTVDEEGRMVSRHSGVGSSKPPIRKGSGWGARGISVSADEGVSEPQRPQKTKLQPGDSTVRDDELAGILEDHEEDDEDDGFAPPLYRQEDDHVTDS